MPDPEVSEPGHPSPAEVAVTGSDFSPPRGTPFPIVGIGASAGGLEAFGRLLAAMPSDSGMAFVLVQHLDPQHESLLPELLAPLTSMRVVSVSDEMAVQPGHVYVIPPNTSMELHDGVLRLAAREPGLHLPIDIFFRSLAKVQGSRAIGIVLSGNASDGSLGVRAIKAECGITFAQDEHSARFGGMPRNAVATGAIDYVLPPDGIARELASLARHPYLIPSRPGDARSETLPEGDGELRRIFALLHTATKVDFSHYKPTTIRRRIGRRMMVLRLETMIEYRMYLEQHPPEVHELYRDLLISVTSFFRDAGSFEALSQLLVGNLTGGGRDQQPVRAWVPGCATGEEVYSLAISIYELLHEKQHAVPLQLFGTDISDVALERARHGIYSGVIEDDVSPERLRRFFTKVDSGYQISKPIRESCIFARHDVTKDPPFSNLDAVSCRNVLIYLDQAAQRRVLPIFHYALKPTGLLMLGTAESAAAAADLFASLDKQHRIFSRKPTAGRLPADMGVAGPAAEATAAVVASAGTTASDLHKKLERLIQTRYSPDAVLVDEALQIVQFRGHTSPYLDPSPGEASLNLLRMAKESLVVPLRRVVQNAAERNLAVSEAGIPIEIAGRREEITLEVVPLGGNTQADRHYFVVFRRDKPADSLGPLTPPDDAPPDEDVGKLRNELAETRDYLRNLTEEYEAHAEELRAANEEARSANEELQSTNEELGTTKEELQSANEELTTVNEELQSRNQELSATNSDLKNLLSAITIPIVMVDSDLRVRRFNSAAANLLELGPVDVGRPVGHIRGRIQTPDLEQQVKNVVETLHPCNQELQDREECWHLLTIRPYRTLDDRIAGAVITFQNIDPLKRGLQIAEQARDYAEGMIETVREPLIVLDADCRVQRATTAFYDTFLVSREETEGRFLYDLGNGQWNRSRLRELIGAALFRSEPFHDFEVDHDFPHIGRRSMRLNGRRIPFPNLQHRMLLLSIEDVTERREIAEVRFQRLFETAKDGIVVIDVESETIRDVNPYVLQVTGFSREDFIGRDVAEVAALLQTAGLGDLLEATRQVEVVRRDDVQLTTRDRRQLSVDVVANRYQVGSKPVIQLNIRDVTARKQAAKALRESEQRFRLFVESVRDYALFQTDLNGTILTWNTGAERLLGWEEKEIIGRNVALLFTPEDVAAGEPERELETTRTTGRAAHERWHVRRDGSRFFASGVLTQVCDERATLLGFARVMRDITALKEQEEELRRSVEEKSALVREIHHRVKNNLQVIVSLLSLQAHHSDDPRVLAAFEETEGRVRAIAQIHERLYASDDLTEVEFASYLTRLARELVTLHKTNPGQVALELDVADVVLHIEQAIPLALIANELIVNSLKHGLGGDGRLLVSLSHVGGSFRPELGQTADDGWARIGVADSGPGLPAGLDVSRTDTLGLRLVSLLVRQLRGRFEIGAGPGANLAVKFPLDIEQRSSEGVSGESARDGR
jgi:two-component system CheB/CheR fusion protein